MKTILLLAAAIAVGLAACGQSTPPPAPKTEAKPAAAAPAPSAPMPPAAPSAPPASAGQDAGKKDEPKK